MSFYVPRGAIFGLLGPNGAGKSTLVRILSTLTVPSSGRAAVLGHDVRAEPLEARRRLAVVLQQTAAETLLTVRDNLLVYARLHGLDRRTAAARAQAVAEEFGLEERLADTVQDLSIGTKRRIQVAKIFMLEAPVIILDEATTGMDPMMKRRTLERLRAEARKGRTILLTTQVLSEAEELCDSILILHRGRTMAAGTLAELRRRAAHVFRVRLTFARVEDDLGARLQALAPAELELSGASAELVFHGEEVALLEKLAVLARSSPILEFEVRRATLEEVFVNLVSAQ
ncbi:MAG TPA: ABC transporter ATP-binding protein [Burkholderiales bacterium]|nr:ABC transporter ATP-binding protein [Burkholderiales bacterium]